MNINELLNGIGRLVVLFCIKVNGHSHSSSVFIANGWSVRGGQRLHARLLDSGPRIWSRWRPRVICCSATSTAFSSILASEVFEFFESGRSWTASWLHSRSNTSGSLRCLYTAFVARVLPGAAIGHIWGLLLMRDGKLDSIVGMHNVAHELSLIVEWTVVSALTLGVIGPGRAPPRLLVRARGLVRLGHSVPVWELCWHVRRCRCINLLVLVLLIAITFLTHCGLLSLVVVDGEDFLVRLLATLHLFHLLLFLVVSELLGISTFFYECVDFRIYDHLLRWLFGIIASIMLLRLRILAAWGTWVWFGRDVTVATKWHHVCSIVFPSAWYRLEGRVKLCWPSWIEVGLTSCLLLDRYWDHSRHCVRM